MQYAKIYATLPPEMKVALTDAAHKVGLTGAAEYLRICAYYLVEHQELPPQLAGRRAIMKMGRPRVAYRDEERAEDDQAFAVLHTAAAVTRAQARS